MKQRNRFIVSYKEVLSALPYMLINIIITLLLVIFSLICFIEEYFLVLVITAIAIMMFFVNSIFTIMCLIAHSKIEYFRRKIVLTLTSKIQSIAVAILLVLTEFIINEGIDRYFYSELANMLPLFIMCGVCYVINGSLLRKYIRKYAIEYNLSMETE